MDGDIGKGEFSSLLIEPTSQGIERFLRYFVVGVGNHGDVKSTEAMMIWIGNIWVPERRIELRECGWRLERSVLSGCC